MDNNCIYIYYDKDGIPFYVGRGLKNRPKSHLSPSNLKLKKCKFFHSKLSGMIERDEFFEIKIIRNNISVLESIIAEEILIAMIGRRDLGLGPLCNLTDGGEGPKNTIVSKETREKLSKSSSGRKMSEDAKRKIGLANKGKKHTKEQIENHRKFMTGRKLSEEHKRKIKISNTGKFVSEKTREKLRNNQLGVKYKDTSNFKKAAIERCKNLNVIKKTIETKRSKTAIPVIQYNDGGFHKEWNSQHEAKDNIENLIVGKVMECCRGNRNTHLGFKWKYKKEKGLL